MNQINQISTDIFLYGTRAQTSMLPVSSSPSPYQQLLSSVFPGQFNPVMTQHSFNRLGAPTFFNPKTDITLLNGPLRTNIPVMTKPVINSALLLQQMAPMAMLQRQQSEQLKALLQFRMVQQSLAETQAKLAPNNTNNDEKVINNSPVKNEEVEEVDTDGKYSSELAEETDDSAVKQEDIPKTEETIVFKPKAVKTAKKNVKSKKIKKKRNTCGHPDKRHYAKGMCNNCYHKYGRFAKPTLCEHELLYAKGLCQKCYVLAYNQKKADKADKSCAQSE